jgi:hypothetical protein
LIKTPANKLLIHTHRDTQKYPYLEELAAWAETYRFFKFGDLGVGDNTSIIVDIKYWNVLQREGTIVTTINQQNNPDLFKKFMFTGLSNFDFFASDFITQYQNSNPKTI